jgi:phosphatidate cytidylyltransferase
MATRILTGVILAPLVVLVTWFLPDTGAFALVVLACFAASRELLLMSSVREDKVLLWGGAVWASLCPLLAGLAPEYLVWYAGGTPMVVLVASLFFPGRIASAFHDVSAGALNVLYVGGLFGFVGAIATLRNSQGEAAGAVPLLMLFAVVWMGDTGAYFGGKTLGRHKLYAAVSPKKTVEGGLFGLLGSMGGAALVHGIAGTALSWPVVLLLGLAGGVLEQVGDFGESLLKRSSGVKDSGALLPGHGGMLDRIDGLLFAAPVVYLVFTCWGA